MTQLTRGFFGVDCGGSLCKLCIYEPLQTQDSKLADNRQQSDQQQGQPWLAPLHASTRYGSTGIRDDGLCLDLGHGRLHFIRFATSRMESAVTLMMQHLSSHQGLYGVNDGVNNGNGGDVIDGKKEHPASSTPDASSPIHISMTGGGAHKFAHWLETHPNAPRPVVIERRDEMQSLVLGLHYLLTRVSGECFSYCLKEEEEEGKKEGEEEKKSEKKEEEKKEGKMVKTEDGKNNTETGESVKEKTGGTSQEPELVYSSVPFKTTDPYLLVNVGTGVSILKVEADGRYERISGTALGGGTYWGLVQLLTKIQSFDESLTLCQQGNPNHVNMTVGDIYGGAYDSLHLPADMTASFLAKPHHPHTDADLCTALMLMVTNNLGQIVYLLARQLGMDRIVFSGNFLRPRASHVAPVALSRALSFWSRGEVKAYFLRHEGYCGALGAFLMGYEEAKGALATDLKEGSART